ncbi:MAG TPA: NADH-quinone oxidoreductase subunit C [Vicinamibacterales bacterium]|jgi:NADH-quinone oxidoreductase subunit C|nr:NADH-quinone oxidoreductase subunit C [Vicinamibacterales bacterium]
MDDPKDPPAPPQAAADKPPSDTPGEPLKGEVSRTEAPGAGVSAVPAAAPAGSPAAPPAAPAAAAPAAKPAAPAKPAVPAVPKPAAPAAAHDTKPAPPAGPPDPPPPAGAAIPAFITRLQAAVPGAVEHVSFYVGDWTVIVPVSMLVEAGRYLRDTPGVAFDFCSDVTASDWPSRPKRFDVIYCLYSTRHHTRVRLKVRAGEHDPVPSVSGVWPAANWLEREVYDLFGVNFTGHPDRRRILMPDDWQGFPQRKDYPLEGPGELLMESPLDWLKLKQAREEADIE